MTIQAAAADAKSPLKGLEVYSTSGARIVAGETLDDVRSIVYGVAPGLTKATLTTGRPLEVGLALGQVDLVALGGQAAREGDLVVVDVLAQAVLAGHDDRDGAHVPGPQDGPGPAVADDRGRGGHGRLEGVELEVGLPLDLPGRRGRGAGLHQAAQLARVPVQPGRGPADQAVEGVVVGADGDQQQRSLAGDRHSRLPMTLPLG